MSVSVMVGGSPKVVADQIQAGTIANLGLALSIYTGSVWLACDGTAVSRTTYAQLFAAIGTSFGPGDGATTFNLPIRAKLSNRPLVNLTSSNTFAAFAEDTDIVVNNGTAASIDISAGAVVAGIRISILEKSATGITIFTDTLHTQICVLPQGAIVLGWDGGQWCLISETVRIRVTISASGTWKTPFAGFYMATAVGGGGGGGCATSSSPPTSAGGGGGGGLAYLTKAEPAGTTLTFVVGAAGNGSTSPAGNGTAGGTTTISDSSGVIAAGPGGGGGGGASNGANGGGGGGGSPPSTYLLFAMSGASAGFAGGNSAWNLGTGGAALPSSGNGNPGTGIGAGGSGGFLATGGSSKNGGNGTGGCCFIEY